MCGTSHYNGTVFYRVVKGFVIQMGSWDANVKGRAGTCRPRRWKPITALSNLRGTRGYGAGAEPDSASAEFFINLADNTPLDHKADDTGNTTGYTVFGQVISGMDVVDAISEVPVGDHGPDARPGAGRSRHRSRKYRLWVSPMRRQPKRPKRLRRKRSKLLRESSRA